MQEAMSSQLVRLLFDLQLVTPRDLRRARGRVRALAADLPAFDTVWLDALVQDSRLTPFQSRLLEQTLRDIASRDAVGASHGQLANAMSLNSESPGSGAAGVAAAVAAGVAAAGMGVVTRIPLAIGPYNVRELLGDGPHGQTLLVQLRGVTGPKEPVVVKLLTPELSAAVGLHTAIDDVVSRAAEIAHPAVIGPHACRAHEGRLAIVSRYVPGLTLAEMLVRRGRFPATVVRQIAVDVSRGLVEFEARNVVHGDLRLSKFRMRSDGSVAVVDAGLRAPFDAAKSLHHRMSAERFDTVAPELIGNDASPNAASDAYSLGCCLWQLLAGRPPYPGADPMAKLAAHRSRRIDDVRRWAPDTPVELAVAISKLTERDPSRRPRSARAVAALFAGRRGWKTSRSTLRRYRRAFENPPRVAPETDEQFRWNWTVTAAALFAVTGIAAMLADSGARTELLSITMGRLNEAWSQRSIARDESASSRVADGRGAGTASERSTDDGERSTKEGERSLRGSNGETDIIAGGSNRRNRGGFESGNDSAVSNAPAGNTRQPGEGASSTESQAERKRQMAELLNKYPVLPAPNANGEIVLTTAGPYRADQAITYVGPLTIRSSPGVHGVLVLTPDSRLLLTAETVLLDGVDFEVLAPQLNARMSNGAGDRSEIDGRSGTASSKPGLCVGVVAQELTVRGCRFRSYCSAMSALKMDEPVFPENSVTQRLLRVNSPGEKSMPDGETDAASSPAASGAATALIAWKLARRDDPTAGQGRIENCIFIGDGAAIHLAFGSDRFLVSNVLRIGSGPFVRWRQEPGLSRKHRQMAHVWKNVALRQSGAAWRQILTGEVTGDVELEIRDSVLDCTAKSSGMIEFIGSGAGDMLQRFRIDGTATLYAAAAGVATEMGANGRVTVLDDSTAKVEGLSANGFAFAGPLSLQPLDSELDPASIDLPRENQNRCGILAELLPISVGRSETPLKTVTPGRNP